MDSSFYHVANVHPIYNSCVMKMKYNVVPPIALEHSLINCVKEKPELLPEVDSALNFQKLTNFIWGVQNALTKEQRAVTLFQTIIIFASYFLQIKRLL